MATPGPAGNNMLAYVPVHKVAIQAESVSMTTVVNEDGAYGGMCAAADRCRLLITQKEKN